MTLCIEKRRLYILATAFTVLLFVGITGIARYGNRAFAFASEACRKAAFLFGENFSPASAIAATLLALLASGLVSAMFGFVRDMFTLHSLERRAMRNATSLGENPRVFLTTGIAHQAWTSGFFRPRIYIASEFYARLSGSERKALVEHELAHARNHDMLKRAIADALRRLFWFVPTAAEIVRAIRFDQEVRADQAAMAVAGKRALCGLYLSVGDTEAPAQASGFAFTSPRLAEVLDGKSLKAELSPFRLIVSLLMASLVVFGGWGGIAEDAAAEAPPSCARAEIMTPHVFPQTSSSVEFNLAGFDGHLR